MTFRYRSFSYRPHTRPSPLQKRKNSIQSSPLERGKHLTQISHYQQENSTSNLPSREGQGVCDAQVQFPEIKSIHPKPTDTSSLHQVSRNGFPQHLYPCRASHRNTPLNPLSRGEASHSNLSLSNKNQHPNLPSREGSGVCDVRAQLPKPKATTQSQEIPPRQTAVKTPHPNPRFSP